MRAAWLSTLLVIGCSSPRGVNPHTPQASAASAPAPVSAAPGLPFVEDDYARALADARARHLPLFVDTWALWCHACMSMRAYVFTDPALARERDKVVWLSIDTEKEANAPFVSKFGFDALPTLFVIDPTAEAPLWKYAGTMSARELVAVLDDVTTASSALAGARRAGARGDVDEARAAYERVIASSPPRTEPRAIAADELLALLSTKKRDDDCAEIAARELPSLGPGTHRANVAVTGALCAEESAVGSRGRAHLRALADAVAEEAADPASRLVPDDRSGLYEELVSARKTLGEPDRARAAAADWSRFLDAEAARATTPAARSVFDAHRLLAYLELGQPERAIPMLEQSERDFPADYDPPVRLARALFEMKRYDDALVAAHRALGKAYGGRKLRIWKSIADIDEAKGDRAAEARELRDALSFAATIPLREGYAKLRDQLAARLAALGSAGQRN